MTKPNDKSKSANVDRSHNSAPKKPGVRREYDDVQGIIVMPHDVRDPEVWREATRYQLIYSSAGLVLGLVCIIGGVILFLHGVTGATSWTAKVIGLQSNISDAAPGAVLFIVGLFIVFITRFVVKANRR
jgi:hypothetical protein